MVVIAVTLVVLVLQAALPIIIAVVLVAAVVLMYCLLVSLTYLSSSPGSFKLMQLAIAMAFPFDNLFVHILCEIFISML